MRFLHLHNVVVHDHPAQSPDLNCIEEAWSILKSSINETMYTDYDDFVAHLKDTWDHIDQNVFRRIINTFPDRVHAVIANKGGPTKW